MIDIVKMLLPPVDGPPPRRAQLFGPAAAVYDLCKNGQFGVVPAWHEVNVLLI